MKRRFIILTVAILTLISFNVFAQPTLKHVKNLKVGSGSSQIDRNPYLFVLKDNLAIYGKLGSGNSQLYTIDLDKGTEDSFGTLYGGQWSTGYASISSYSSTRGSACIVGNDLYAANGNVLQKYSFTTKSWTNIGTFPTDSVGTVVGKKELYRLM